MSKVIVIADDLTGANATSVLLARKGFKAATFLNLDKYESSTDLNIVSINTDSRAIKKEEAYERVKKVVEFFKDEDIRLFTKRIDSTMRGNIGAEVSAVLDSQTKNATAIVVPSFPSSGRVCIGGYLMVHQVPLEKTDVSKDHKTPVHTSRVTEILEEQMNEKIGFVELGKVLKGAETIHDEIMRLSDNGFRAIVIDATTNDDIAEIARAVKMTNLNVVSVDPGPFTAALAEEYLEVPQSEMGQKVMFTIGSVSNLSKKQLDEFKLEYPVLIAEVDASNLVYHDTRKAEVEKAADKLLSGLSGFEVIGVTTLSESKILNLYNISQELEITEDEVSQRISSGLAEITLKVLKDSNSLIGGLYTSGGDVTVAVCNALGAAGIEVKDEVLPLAVYGRVIDGEFDNIPIITKGGLIGDEKTLIKCINYMLTKLSNEYHSK